MSIKLGIIMDPLPSINIKKDSSFAMLLAAQKRGWILHCDHRQMAPGGPARISAGKTWI